MPILCPVDLNTAALRSEISNVYERVAEEPEGEFHFHRGPAYAAEFLCYDADELAALPADCTASFAGIGNPLAIGPIHTGETVSRYRLRCWHGSIVGGQAYRGHGTRDRS